MYQKFFSFFCLVLVTACETHYGDRCLSDVQKIAAENQLTPHIFETKLHRIFALRSAVGGPIRSTLSPPDLHVYIEGDGLAWASQYGISLDPTPVEPTGLILAMADQSSAIKVYLGRPGHYLEDDRLGLYSWTFARFSTETIETYVDIIDQLQNLYPQSKISLFGYSGGALIALLTAAKRYEQGHHDIERVVTFAGVLDHKAWSEFHDSSPLTFSLNSLECLEALRHIPQHHYSGLKDTIAPLKLAQSYGALFQENSVIEITPVPTVTHWQGWKEFWEKESKSSS